MVNCLKKQRVALIRTIRQGVVCLEWHWRVKCNLYTRLNCGLIKGVVCLEWHWRVKCNLYTRLNCGLIKGVVANKPVAFDFSLLYPYKTSFDLTIPK
jgi:hypothetical protein